MRSTRRTLQIIAKVSIILSECLSTFLILGHGTSYEYVWELRQ